MTRSYSKGPRWHTYQARRDAPDRSRVEVMAVLYREGQTLAEIGRLYGISRERVRQLMTLHLGIRAKDGGRAVATKKKAQARDAAKAARCLKKHGCLPKDYSAIPGKARTAFRSQRNAARQRGIPWQMTIWQWWGLWQASGLWASRGRGHGYVMCRRGDVGAYSPENVFFATGAENSSTRRNRKSALPMGVSRATGGFTAKKMIGGKTLRLGTFPTPEQAHAAYLAAAPVVVAPSHPA